MKNKIVIQTLLFIILIPGISFAQDSFSKHSERELIVHFNEEVVTHSRGLSSGLLSEYSISSTLLQQSLDSADIEFMGKLIPDFRKEDRNIQTREGKQVSLSDWSRTFLIRIPVNGSVKKLIERLERIPSVAYAEENGKLESTDVKSEYFSIKNSLMPITPNDNDYDRQWWIKNTASSNQGNGTIDADVDGDDAWDYTTGSSSVKIAIIDSGVDTGHEEFQGKITGDGSDAFGYHGTVVAGIAAAKGNNNKGIAGVAYGSSIINEDYGNATATDLANAVISAKNRGANILNNSWKYVNSNGDIAYSVTIRRAIRDAYKVDKTVVAAMGNTGDNEKHYPAAIREGVITVGATTNSDAKASYSSTGSWLD